MTLSAGLDVLHTHLVTAGNAVTPKLTLVSRGEMSSTKDRIDYWIDGIGAPERFAGATETLTDHMFGVAVSVRVYRHVPDRSQTLASNIEEHLYAASLQIASAVMGNVNLGGNCTATTFNGVEFGWLNVGGAWVRVATTSLVFDFVETITIAA